MPALSLPVDARSVAAARRLLRSTLDGHQQATIEDAVLMISELVTNAVRHARAAVLVLVTDHRHTVHVSVTDDNPTLPVAGREPEHHATSGRGLGIVDTLADRWGIIPTSDGKTIWFEIDVDTSNASP
jgi:anti-sigma regulatory factor (Ser/Thr protein kinase)